MQRKRFLKDREKEIGKVVDNSWPTAMHHRKVFISRLMDDGEVWRGSVRQPFSIFISVIRKPIFLHPSICWFTQQWAHVLVHRGAIGHKWNISLVDRIHLC